MTNVRNIEDLGMLRASSKQLGDKYLCGDRNHVYGYQITEFNGMNPSKVELVRAIENNDDMTWDKAYDTIFGTPNAPKFGKHLLA